MIFNKKNSSWAVIVSALLFNGALIYPTYFDWFVFLFLIPIFYGALQGLMRFKQGFLWGLFFFTIHFYPIADLIWYKASGYGRSIVWIMLILYCSLWSGMWFATACWLSNNPNFHCIQSWGPHFKLMGPNRSFVRLDSYWMCIYKRMWCASMWVVVTMLYFWWVYSGILWFVGKWYGYCFALPILPLAHHHQWLVVLSITSLWVVLFFLVAMQMSVTLWLLDKHHIQWLVVTGLGASIFIGGWFIPCSYAIPEYVSAMSFVKPPERIEHPLDYAQAIQKAINDVIEKRPNTRWAFLPESVFPYALNTMPEIVELITDITISDGVTVIIGAPRVDANKLYNSVYLLADSQISATYDKTFLMPFGEYIPWPWNQLPLFKTLLIKNNKEFSPHYGNTDTLFTLDNTLHVYPCICSDLFFNRKTIKNTTNHSALCIVNDTWFSFYYMRHLMFLYAKLHALAEQKNYIYISYHYGIWIGKSGITVNL